ncbi:hypothetical protein CEQ90_08255 [Lewinellaceae bacterium SD302]|nr:hypothetical protein CEQ90_08255 [Lewinellaceae bacterium SD302]
MYKVKNTHFMRHAIHLIALFLITFSTLSAKTVTADDCQPWVACQQFSYVALPEDGCTTILQASSLADAGSACGIVPIMEVLNPGPYTIGTYFFTVRASIGNQSADCSGQVIVQDKTAPEPNCINQTLFTLDPQTAFNEAILAAPVDNCDANPTAFAFIFEAVDYGTFDHDWSIVDESENYSYCTSRTTIRPIEEPYCTPAANSSYEYINQVNIYGMDNSNIFNPSGDDNGYGYYVNEQARVSMGEHFGLFAAAGGVNTISLGWEVFIDFNNDGDFNDLNERVYHNLGSDPTLNIDIFVPFNLGYLGKRRMRVFLQYAGTDGPCQAGAYGYGEYEDYIIDIRFTTWNPWGSQPGTDQDIVDAEAQNINTQTDDTPLEIEVNSTSPLDAPTLLSNRTIYPNPARANTPVHLQLGDRHGISQLIITNTLGQEVIRVSVLENRAHIIDLPKDLPAGFYVVNGLDANQQSLWAEQLVLH